MYDKELLEVKKKVDKLLAHKTPEYRQGYNKAIDDFVNQCKENVVCNTFGFRITDIEKIAELLKSKTDF